MWLGKETSGSIVRRVRAHRIRLANGPLRKAAGGPYLLRSHRVASVLAFLESPKASQYGPRVFKGRAGRDRRHAASVERMSDGAGEQGDGGHGDTDEGRARRGV